MTNETPLRAQLRDLKFQQRLEQVALISQHDTPAERMEFATTLIREIAMHRIFDRFTKPQETDLLEVLEPLAYPPGEEHQHAFGLGAFDTWSPPENSKL